MSASNKQFVPDGALIDEAMADALARIYGIDESQVNVIDSLGAEMVEEMKKAMGQEIAQKAFEAADEAGMLAATSAGLMNSAIIPANDDEALNESEPEIEQESELDSPDDVTIPNKNQRGTHTNIPDALSEKTGSEPQLDNNTQRALSALENFGKTNGNDGQETSTNKDEDTGDVPETIDAEAPPTLPTPNQNQIPENPQQVQQENTNNETEEDEVVDSTEQGAQTQPGQPKINDASVHKQKNGLTSAHDTLPSQRNQEEQPPASAILGGNDYQQFSDQDPSAPQGQNTAQENSEQSEGKPNERNSSTPAQDKAQKENDQAVQAEQLENDQQQKIEDDINKRKKRIENMRKELEKIEQQMSNTKKEISSLKRKIRRRYYLMILCVISGILAVLVLWLRHKNKLDKEKIPQLEAELKKQENEKTKVAEPLQKEQQAINQLASQRNALVARKKRYTRS